MYTASISNTLHANYNFAFTASFASALACSANAPTYILRHARQLKLHLLGSQLLAHNIEL